MAQHTDVLVVGGGIAGLIAARDLSREGVRVEVVEARDELGGRIATRRSPDWPLPVELGAEFVHGRPEPLLRVIDDLGLSLDRLADVHDRRVGGRLVRQTDFWDRLGRILQRRDPGRDYPAAELARSLEGDDADLFRLIVEGFHAAPLEDVGVESLAGDASASGDPEDEAQHRVRGGYGAVVEGLASELRGKDVRLSRGCPVRAIEWRKGVVAASVERAGRPVPLTAKRALVTVSVGALQEPADAGGLRFSPDLEGKRPALSQLAMGHAMRVVLCFRGAFWKGAPPDLEFLHDSEQPFPTFWRSGAGDLHHFVAWAGGPKALALSDKAQSYLVPLALEALCQILGADVEAARARLVAASAHGYSSDPFVRGAYSYVRPGGTGARAVLAAPVEDTLFFAGEATDREHSATVAGAIASGERAAREILASL